MKRILLVNPPIFDFSAYDFWLKPFGVLRVGGYLRRQADLRLFDFLDRGHPSLSDQAGLREDSWGRGKFLSTKVRKPPILSEAKGTFRRYGLSNSVFSDYLQGQPAFDFALIQTSMTYWYLGVREVLETLRCLSPSTKTVLGGVYATICPHHAAALGADLLVSGSELGSLWDYLDLRPDLSQPPFWEGYSTLQVGVAKLSDGCPFRCTYCSVPSLYPCFTRRPLQEGIEAARLIASLGASNMVFYDDALLFKPEEVLIPYLRSIQKYDLGLDFHTPNALNARFVTPELAQLFIETGFQQLYLGFESSSAQWQKTTGGKVYPRELERAVKLLAKAGARQEQLNCYLIAGHPRSQLQDLENSMRFVNSLGVRIMLSEFSPIPGTPDGELCREWVDLEEPLFHNKTAFTRKLLGQESLQNLKRLCKELNNSLKPEVSNG
jgi:hypothetical protein